MTRLTTFFVISLICLMAVGKEYKLNPIKIKKGTTFIATNDTYTAFNTRDIKIVALMKIDIIAMAVTNYTLLRDKQLLVLKLDIERDKSRGIVIENYLMKGIMGLVIIGVLTAGTYALVKKTIAHFTTKDVSLVNQRLIPIIRWKKGKNGKPSPSQILNPEWKKAKEKLKKRLGFWYDPANGRRIVFIDLFLSSIYPTSLCPLL